jgi:hypothetical protein
MQPADPTSPWWPIVAKGKPSAYVGRNHQLLKHEVAKGNLRAVRIGGKRELFTRQEWLDDWMLQHEQPVAITVRRPRGAA